MDSENLQDEAEAYRHLMGYVDFPTRPEITASLPLGTVSKGAPWLLEDTDNTKDVLLYKAWKDVLGAYPKYVRQAIGDCTSFGSAHACDLTQCIEIALGEPEEYKEISTEAWYGLGREIAGMLRGGDGCYGSAMAKVATDIGVVPRELIGPYSGQRANEWGHNGVPADIKKAAAEHKFDSTIGITTLQELDAGLNSGYVGIVCSNQGFTMTRDSTGACRASGSWPHCMGLAGRRFRNSKPEYLINQSWGPNTPSGPLMDDQPDFSFWAEGNTVARMLSGKDSFLWSKFGGFRKRNLPDGWSYASMS